MISKDEVVVVSISDVHMGHRYTTTSFIIANLRKYFLPRLTKEVDLVLIAGDFWEMLLQTPSEEVSDILYWIVEFLSVCKENKIIVRVLEGTPYHDVKQSRLFVTANNMLKTPVDLKHVTTLSIEHIESLGLDVLYVPDRWSDHADDTYKQVMELLAREGLEKVDVACMHGAFEYQIPKSNETHVESRYLDIVRHYIFIGHVHIFSTYDRIISNGSFDRTGHGYETPKGFVRAVLRRDAPDSFEFIENEGAMLYLTLDFSNQSVQDIHAFLYTQTWHNGARLRLMLSATQAASGLLKALVKAYPQWHFKREIVGAIKTLKPRSEVKIPAGPTICKETILGVLKARLDDLDVSQMARAEELIKQIS
ncbi:hypothetical protein ACLPJK_26220 [Pseudomonas aeruginosa]|uniref:hypothetical protein n=1 Tax=Pseudomonas aeruginosa TaxID=287 RepID=UPI003D2C6BD8